MSHTTDRRISRRTLIGGSRSDSGTSRPHGRRDRRRRRPVRAVRGAADPRTRPVGDRARGPRPRRHRTLNHDLTPADPTHPGKVVEIGGQWIGPTQDHLATLARELGVQTFKTYNDGNYLFHESGKITPCSPKGPLGPIPPDLTADAQIQPLLTRLDEIAKTVPLAAPWTAPNADEWDGQTFETFKRAQGFGTGANGLLDLTIEDSRFVGGSQLISIRAAQSLGKRVMLSQPVRRISQGRGGVTVYTDALTVKGRQVIVTGPPSLTALIRYEPDLPALRAQLLQRFPQGSAIKVEAVYRRPFWRERGLAGQVTSDTGPIKLTFDNSPPDGSPGVLLGFVEPAGATSGTPRPAS